MSAMDPSIPDAATDAATNAVTNQAAYDMNMQAHYNTFSSDPWEDPARPQTTTETVLAAVAMIAFFMVIWEIVAPIGRSGSPGWGGAASR